MRFAFFQGVLVLVLCFVVTAFAQVERSGFGEACDHDINLKCNKSQWLSCQNGICDCAKPDEMVFDNWKDKCVSKAGERCKFEIDESVVDTDTIFRMYEKAECITNGQCAADGTCVCKQTFYEAFNGTCVSQGMHGDRCASNYECRGDKFFTCIDGTCDCNSTWSHHSAESNQCVGRGGHKCLNGKCVDNAECKDETDNCICSPDNTYYQDQNGLCQQKKEHGQVCSSHKECLHENVFLTCENGSCSCASTKTYKNVQYYQRVPNPARFKYDGEYYCATGDSYTKNCDEFIIKFAGERLECVGKAGNDCNEKNNCVVNSFCNPLDKICTCNSTFFPTSDGSCGLDYNEVCNMADKICSDEFDCTEKQCKCKFPGHQVHNGLRCQSLAAGPCANNDDCVANMHCDLPQGFELGQCECVAGFIENGAGRCEIAFGSKCDHNGAPSCDRLAALKCRNGICSCPDRFQDYDVNRRRCVGLVGTRCSGKLPGWERFDEHDCIENASCQVVPGTDSGRCKCVDGFELTSERKCAAVPNPVQNATLKPQPTVPPAGSGPKIFFEVDKQPSTSNSVGGTETRLDIDAYVIEEDGVGDEFLNSLD